MTGREHSTTRVTSECSGHGVRCALNCRRGGRRLRDRSSGAGVTMENGRVVKLLLEDFGLTGAVPAEIGQLTCAEGVGPRNNQLTSVPAEIGQLTSLTELDLGAIS